MNIPQIIGEFFENLLADIFSLERIDKNFSHKTADLRGKGFYLESKASRFDNGGVIKGWQLRDLKKLNIECPYAFCYHDLRTPIWHHYPTERILKRALARESPRIYIIPLSVVDARYKHDHRRPYRNTGDDYVQIKESFATGLLDCNSADWRELHLNPANYARLNPFVENIFILSDNKQTLEALLGGFNPQVYRKVMRARV